MKLLSSVFKDNANEPDRYINKLISNINKSDSNNDCLLSIYHVPGIVLSALTSFTHVILTTTYELSTVITLSYG